MTESTTAEQVQLALGEVWDRTYSVIVARVDAVEEATAQLLKQHPEVELIDAGRTEAHKLAGVLGTFGLNRGTELARALERMLSTAGTAGEAAEAESLVTELRSVVDHATSAGRPRRQIKLGS